MVGGISDNECEHRQDTQRVVRLECRNVLPQFVGHNQATRSAVVLQPQLDELVCHRLRQTHILLDRRETLLLHALVPPLRGDLPCTLVLPAVFAPSSQARLSQQLLILQLDTIVIDALVVVVVDLHDNVLQMLARLSRFLTSNPIRFCHENGSVWYLGTG